MIDQQLQHNRLRIGQRIAQLREEQGLTQAALAEMIGMQQQHISRLEKGRYSARLDLLATVAAALGGSVDIIPRTR